MKPILFNTEMVKAILDGRKTVTRRLIKPRPLGYFEVSENPTYLYDFEPSSQRIYPRYQAGDILYVRETWCDRWLPDGFLEGNERYGYKADGIPTLGYWGNDSQCKNDVWIPSIHMPKEAARIFLHVSDVRVERLQDITEDHAIKEGTPYELCGGWKPTFYNPDSGGPDPDFIDGFSKLWNSTVDMKNHWMDQSWGANPWVWVIEFERISKEEAKCYTL